MKRLSRRNISLKKISQEWDRLAETRDRQVRTGIDDSMTRVLAPAVLELLCSTDTKSVVDIGCGTGWLTARMARLARHVVGVDMSTRSIEMAMRGSALPNIEYVNSEFLRFARTHQHGFSVAVANMTLMTVVPLESFVRAIACVLKRDGHLILTIGHPCFWPLYWRYARCPWFRYWEETVIQAPFKIRAERTVVTTTHVHRPLDRYIAVFQNCGFRITKFKELTGKGFALPRFLAVKCQKAGRRGK
jgi:2-polyprenyl-3-methyl-5-hydroxy-6-metoxy-1,4-benzoquinol methylase